MIIKEFKKTLSSIEDKVLKEMVNEINEYENTGILPEKSTVRALRKIVIKKVNEDLFGKLDIDCRSITIPQIYKEIARRYFKEN